MSLSSSRQLFAPLMGDAQAEAILSDRGYVRRMLAFEAALARAEGRVGAIPKNAADAISSAVEALHESDIDEITLAVAEGTARAGTPVIPLVRLLTARVAEAGQPFVHWGATTQDVMDTALVLQLRDLFSIFDRHLRQLGDALAELALTHRDTPMIARTVMQHALPTTFGLKAAGWLTAILRLHGRLSEMKPRALTLQFGGAAGTLASLGPHGPTVMRALADELRLVCPALPWHSARDRIGEAAAFCGLLCGALGKLGRDVALMMQTEAQEAFEPAAPGRGGSSTMPHKRNPVLSAILIGAATAAPGLVASVLSAQMHEHERAAGPAHAEWRVLPELLSLTAGALHAAAALAKGLEVRPDRMRSNIDATNGLVLAEAVAMALAAKLGKSAAHHLVEEACRKALAEGRTLGSVLAEDGRVGAALPAERRLALEEPEAYLGSAGYFVDRALQAHADLPKALDEYEQLFSKLTG